MAFPVLIVEMTSTGIENIPVAEKASAVDEIIGSIFSLCFVLERDYNIKSIALFHHVGLKGCDVNKSNFFRGRDITLIRTDGDKKDECDEADTRSRRRIGHGGTLNVNGAMVA